MIIKDALSILGITGSYNAEIIKKAYRKACSIYHPDRNNAGLEMMKLVNQAYDALRDIEDDAVEGQEKVEINEATYGEELFSALNQIIHLNLEIEICGAWVWLHGDTRQYKEIIKQAGFRWAPNKKLWYYRPNDYKSRSRGNFSMDDIRNIHGSEKVKTNSYNKLNAA